MSMQRCGLPNRAEVGGLPVGQRVASARSALGRRGWMRPHFAASLAMLALAVALALPSRAFAVPVPNASVAVPSDVFIGEDFSFTVTFDNTSLTDSGYGPFVDLIFPVNGIDGAAGTDTADGLDFNGATYLGLSVVATELIFPDDDGAGPGTTGCVDHPYAVDVANVPLEVCGTAGDKLVVLQLPFGSFTNDQPPVDIAVAVTGNILADLGGPLPIIARAGFRYGADPLDNPAIDPSILSDASTDSSTWAESAAATPELVRLTKANDGPEGETATGPNFPRRWTIDIEVAEGQTVTDLDVFDELPNNVAFLSMISTSPAATIIVTPPVGVASNPLNNVVHVNFASVTGGAGSPDAQVVFEYFVPQFDANGPNVIDAATGDDEVSENQARTVGDWNPVDVRDAGGTDNVVVDPVGFEDVLEDKSIAIQKGGAIVIDVGGGDATPGDTLEYTLEVQISDFFTFRDIVINDILSDGQRFDPSFTPTLSLAEHGVGTAGGIALANFSVIDHFTGGAPPVAPINGTQELEFRISDELITRGLDGTVLGGCVPVGGTGGPAPDCALFDGGGTIATLTYRAIIQEDFTDDFPSGDSSVDQGDVIDNSVVIDGTVLANADVVTPTGFAEDDDSGEGFSISRGELEKTIYAINGVVGAGPTCSGGPNDGNACTTDGDCFGSRCLVEVAPGYTITYRLRYELPSSDVEDFRYLDFLPLPVLLAPEVTGFVDSVSAAAPPAGSAKFGPDDTFRALSGIVPVVTTNAVANSVIFTYGDYDDPLNTTTVADILFTVTVTADPFADGLFLTNQARAEESNTFSEPQATDSIIQIVLTQPVLSLTKGIVSTNAPSPVFSPPAVAPQPFSAPGSGCPRFAGLINSNGLTATPIDSTLAGAETGNLVTYALVIENTGSTLTGAFDIDLADLPAVDMIPSGFGVGGINLCITDGTGAALSFTDLGGGLLGGGIRIDDPGATLTPPGALDPFSPTNGRNVLIVTYDMQVSAGAVPEEVLPNVATLSNYAGIEGGPDHTLLDLTDDAEVSISPLATQKAIISTSEAHTTISAGVEQVAIGEIVRYRLEVLVPQSTMPNLRLEDSLPTGLTLLNDGSARLAFVSTSGALTSTTLAGAGLAVVGNEFTLGAVVPTFVLPGGAITGGPFSSGTDPAFSLGSVSNLDNDADQEFIVVEFNALVDNSAAGSNDAGDTRSNSFRVLVNGVQSGPTSNSVTARVVEPSITNLDLTALPAIADAGDTITFTVTYSNPAGANAAAAFDVAMTNALPAGFVLNLGSVAVVLGGGAAGVADTSAGNNVAVTIGSVPPGGTVQITYTATVAAGVAPAQVLSTTANLAYTSLPGANGTLVNPTGSSTPGASGADNGERDGSDGVGGIDDYVDSDPASITIQSLATSKSVVATSEAHTTTVAGIPRVAVGEIVRYRLQTRIPEGTYTNLQLADSLPTGLTFLDDGTARVAFVSNGGGITSSTLGAGPFLAGNEVTIATITPVTLLPGGAISGGPFATGTDPTFSLGTLSNADNDADNEYVVVEFNALVDNSVAGSNDTAENRDNTYRVLINGVQSGATSAAVRIRIHEPSITNVDKVANPASGDAGDTIAYRVTYSNATGATLSTAFDATITDALPADLTLNLASVSVILGGGSAGITDNSAGNTVEVVIASIPPGGTVRIDYTATLNGTVEPRQSIQNTADLVYTSLPGPSGTLGNPTGSVTPGGSGADDGERDGSGTQNDHADSDSAAITVPDPSFAKAVTATSEAGTDPGDVSLGSNPPVAIGEVLTYRLAFSVREGSTQSVTLIDLVPSGLTLVSGSAQLDRSSAALTSIDNPGAINTNVPGVPVPVTLDTGTPGQLRLSLGNVTNSDTNNAVAETYVLTLQMVVANDATNNAGTLLSNTGRLEFLDANFTPVGLNTAQVDVHVAEPVLSVAKSVDTPTASGGDTVTFDIVISNTAAGANAAPAFDWTFTDTLPIQYITPSVVTVNAGVTGATVAAAFTGNTLNGTIDQLDPGESITVTYQAVVDPFVLFGLTVVNTVLVDATSLSDGDCLGGTNDGDACTSNLDCPGGGTCVYGSPGAPGSPTGERTGSGGVNDFATSDNASISIDTPTLLKTNLTPQSYHAVGETATFRVSMGVPVGSQTNVVFTDVLPAGLSYVPGSLVVSLPPMTSSTCGGVNPPCDDTNPAFFQLAGSTMTFDLGNITVATAGTAIITYDVIVDDVIGNQDGTILVNTVQLDLDDPDNPGSTLTLGPVVNDIPVRVGEPDLDLTKAITAGAVGSEAGDTVSWRIETINSGNTTAYQVVWSDVLPDGLFQISNVVVNVSGGDVFRNGTAIPVVSGDAVVSATLNAGDTVSLPSLQIEPGATLRVTFDSTVMNDVSLGESLSNTVRQSYTSIPFGGRDNSTDPGNVDDDDDTDLDNYEESATQSLTIASNIAIDKTVSPTVYTIGEDVTYTIRVDLIEGATPSLVLTDVLPIGLTYQSHLISVGNVGMGFANASYNTRLGAGQTVRFNFGTVSNPDDGNGVNDFFTVTLTARVANEVGNQSGDILRNGEQAEASELYLEYGAGPTRLDFDADGVTPGVQGVAVELIEPVLTISQSLLPSQAGIGTEVSLTVTAAHAGTSTADAFDSVVTITLPAGLTYVPGSASLPPGDVTVVGQTLTFRLGSLTQADASEVFTYRVTVGESLAPGQVLNIPADLEWSSLAGATGAVLSGRTGNDGVGGALNDYASAASSALSVVGPDLVMTKSRASTFTVGQPATYALAVRNQGAASTTGTVTVVDNLPAGLTFVSASGGGWTCNAAGQALTCTNPGPVTPGSTTTITLVVNVSNAAYPTVVNSASVTTPYDSNLANNSDSESAVVRIGDPTATPTLSPTPTGPSQTATSTPAGPSATPTSTGGSGPQPTPTPTSPGGGGSTPTQTGQPTPTQTRQPTATATPFVDIAMVKYNIGNFFTCQTGVFDYEVTNMGNSALEATAGPVILTETLPDGLIYVSESGDGWSCEAVGQDMTCTYAPTLQPRELTTLHVTVYVGDEAYPTINSLATATTAHDSNPQNNYEQENTTVRRGVGDCSDRPTPPGTTATPTPPAAGTPTATPTGPPPTATTTPVIDIAMVKYNIGNFFTCQTGEFDYQVTNMGASAHQVTVGPITINETLPDGLIYVGHSGEGWSCSAIGQDVTCTYPAPLEPRAITMLYVTVYVGDEAYPTINSFATVTTPFDDNPQNNYEQENTTVRRGAGDCSDRPAPPGSTPTPTPTPTGPTPSPTLTTPTPVRSPEPGCEVGISTRYIGVARPGSTIEYRLTWSHACNADLDLFLTQTLPDGMEVVAVDALDAEVSISGNTVGIERLGQPSGAQSAVIRARVLPDTAAGDILCSTALALDPYGRTSESEACLVVASGGEDMRTSLHAHLLSKPGRELSYTARYFGVDEDNSLVLELPENTTLLSIQEPQPTSIAGRILTWEDLPASSGKVRVTVQVAYGLAQGTVLRAQMDFEDALGREILQHETMVVDESAPSGAATIGDLSLSGARQLAAGLETKLAVRYSKVAEVGDLILDLGPEIEYVDSNPPAQVGSDGSLRWVIDGSATVPASGGMKLKVRLKAGTPAGTLIRSIAALSTSNATAVAEHLLVVKNTTNRRSTATAVLKTPKTVVPGLQTQIGVSLKKMPAPVTIDLTLPPDVTPILSIPGSVVTDTGKLRWTFTGEPGELISASVKVKVLVDSGVAAGALLSTTATISSPLGTTSSSGVMTAKGGILGGGGPIDSSRQLSVDLTGATNVEAGIGTTLKVSYKYLSDSGRLEIELPPGISLVESTVPKANDIADGRLAWIGLPAPSGSVQIKALVHPAVSVGQVLTTRATLTDPNGTVATDEISASVR